MSKIIYDPLGTYEQNENKGGVCEIKRFMVAIAATATADLVAAVTGKKIRVLSLNIRANSADCDFQISSNTTAILKGWAVHKNDYNRLSHVIGITETATGEKLACTAGGGSGIEVQGSYIEVVP